MTYTAPGFRGFQELRQATSQKLTIQPESNGASVSVSGTPTYAIYANGGDTALASGNASYSSPTITATLDLSDSSVFPYDRYYRCEFTFSDGTNTYKREVIFDIVRFPTSDDCPCRIDDLRGMHVRIDAALTQASQTSDGNSRYITPAWDELRLFLEAQGIWPTEINRAALVPAIRYMAAANIMRGFMQAPGDIYNVLADKYDAMAADARQHLVAIGRTGDQLTVEKKRGASQPSLTIGPDRGILHHARLDWRRVSEEP